MLVLPMAIYLSLYLLVKTNIFSLFDVEVKDSGEKESKTLSAVPQFSFLEWNILVGRKW